MLSAMPRLRNLVLTVSVAVATIIGCAGSNKGKSGGAVTAGPAGGTPAAWCEMYCQKVAQCWKDMPSDNPNKAPEQVLADCRAQNNGCQVAQTMDMMCCSTQADCANFVGCAYSSKNQPMACQ